MAIHSHHANAILDGHKRVELRKRPLAADVGTVVIYATSPVKKIIGEFTVDGILVTSPDDLWSSVGALSGIDEAQFDSYYAAAESATGILLKKPRRYPAPVPLAALNPAPAVPQSFTYLPSSVLKQLHELVAGCVPSQHNVFATPVVST